MTLQAATADLSPPTDGEGDLVSFLGELREREPVCWLSGFQAWIVTRHADVRSLFADPRLAADPRVYAHFRKPETPGAERWIYAMPFRASSPETPSLGRHLVSRALTPRRVERMERRIREVTERVASSLADRRGRIDLLAEFAAPISIGVLEAILGVPPKGADEVRFRQLAERATRGIRPFMKEKKRRRVEEAAVEMGEYILRLVEERSREPREDMISDLVADSQSGAADPAAIHENIARVVAALVSAGTGTTSTACARALRVLLKHPEQLALLRRDRSLLPNAVRELLRFESGLVVMPRYVREDFSFRGHRFRRGELVALGLLAANRDPRVFDAPDRLNLRRDTTEALSFGYGPHYCIGASLARRELCAMIDAALDLLPPDARLLEEEIRWSDRGLMSQMRSLPVDFGV